MENLTKTKLYSGRFLLCVAGCIAFLLLTGTCCWGIIVTIQSPESNPVLLALVALLSNFLTAIATYYFTKRREGETQ